MKPVAFTWCKADLEALEQCIKTRWEVFAEKSVQEQFKEAGTTGDLPPDCQLCLVVHPAGFDDLPGLCGHCIIYKDTGTRGCHGTAYVEWVHSQGEEEKAAAKKLLSYLKGLRERMIASLPTNMKRKLP